MHVAFDCCFRIWSIFGQLTKLIQAKIEENHFKLLCTRLKFLEIIMCYGKNILGIKFMGHWWLHLLCGLMVGKLVGITNKEAVMVHCGKLGLWVDGAH